MKLYMFRTVPLSIIWSFSLYTKQWYLWYRFSDSLRAGSGWNSVHSWSLIRNLSRCTVTRASNYCDLLYELASRIRMELSSILTLLAGLYDMYHCCVYSGKLLMMDRGTVRNM